MVRKLWNISEKETSRRDFWQFKVQKLVALKHRRKVHLYFCSTFYWPWMFSCSLWAHEGVHKGLGDLSRIRFFIDGRRNTIKHDSFYGSLVCASNQLFWPTPWVRCGKLLPYKWMKVFVNAWSDFKCIQLELAKFDAKSVKDTFIKPWSAYQLVAFACLKNS